MNEHTKKAEVVPSLERLEELLGRIKSAKYPALDSSFVLPADDRPVTAHELSMLGLIELVLKDPRRADALGLDAHLQPVLLPRFVAIGLCSYGLYSIGMILILNMAPAAALPRQLMALPPARWSDGSALSLLLGYTVGLLTATGVCLPSFYFLALLAGVRMSFVQITGRIVRAQASGALVLVGLLPIYAALVLGMIVFEAQPGLLESSLYLGLVLPFIAGLEGVRTLHRGVVGMVQSLPDERRCQRGLFLRWLTLSWSACYTAVCPLMIYRLWEFFSGKMA
jgi:hypothetical protein